MNSNLDKVVAPQQYLVAYLGVLRQLLLASPLFWCLKRLVINRTSDGNKLFQLERATWVLTESWKSL